MKLKLLLLSLLLPFSAFGANTNAFDNVLVKVSWQFPTGASANSFWISDSIGKGAWGVNGGSLTNLNASALASGTVPYPRLPTGTATNILGGAGITVTPASGTYTIASSNPGGTGDVFRALSNVYAAGTTQFMAHASVSNTLQVVGATRLLDGLFFTNGTLAAGNVMTTDGSGNITLQPVPSGGNVFTTSNNTFIASTTNTFNGLVSFSNVLFNTSFNAVLATNLNASNLASGTVPYARLPTGTATNVTGSGGIVITQPTSGTYNVDGAGISVGGATNQVTFGFRSGHTGGSAYTFNTVTNLTTSRTNGTVIARGQFMTVAGAHLIVFARIYGGGMTNIACFTQAAAQSNPIAGHVVLANVITNNTTYTFDVWASSASLGYTNNVSAGATYPAMQNQLGMTLVEHP